MNKTRLEAFSDGVIAIIITIMVLEMKVPHGPQWADLGALWPVFLSYVLSFANVGIYWNNHHHLLHTVKRVNGAILWANLHLLFWLSLMPFATGWMGENHFAALPVAVYAFDLLMCAVAYTVLQAKIIALHGNESVLATAVGRDRKGKASLAAYALAMPLALLGMPVAAGLLMVAVALMWFVPDRRIENVLAE
ncbi:MAG: DUF1211 domain-containing protein [Betaproteobacteria bacterium]|nr:DUF1211 domain-containing protein [Betaproteobacteria bacterium]